MPSSVLCVLSQPQLPCCRNPYDWDVFIPGLLTQQYLACQLNLVLLVSLSQQQSAWLVQYSMQQPTQTRAPIKVPGCWLLMGKTFWSQKKSSNLECTQ